MLRTFLIATILSASLACSSRDKDYWGVMPDEARPIETIAEATKPENIGRVIRVNGKIGSVCQDEGCWMTISDGTAEIIMRFADKTLGVPTDLNGEVVAQGIVREQIVGTARAPELIATGIHLLKKP